MVTFIVRRIIAGFFIVLGASFIAYMLTSFAGDPLASALGISDPTARQQRIRYVTDALNLDQPRIIRYWEWLKGIGKCFVGSCNFGNYTAPGTTGSVNDNLGKYLGVSLKLVTAATVLAIFLGITIGIVTALRQYSGFDYAVTFMTFLFFSLPVFWVGILLKDLVAIKFNNFVQQPDGPTFTLTWILIIAVFFGLVSYSLLRGSFLRRLGIAALVALVFGLLTWYISASHWLLDPKLGIFVFGVLAIAIAFGITTLTAGVQNKRALYTALTTAVIGIIVYYPVQIFVKYDMTFGRLLILLVIAILVGVVSGYAFGGDDRGLNARTGAFTALFVSIVFFIDRSMLAWKQYSSLTFGRPLSTIGDSTPNIKGDFWTGVNDTFSHLLLPTITLMLISLAGHSRYARASMLEVLNQDYIRTARAKGLTERTVIMRHAFRNALIPMTTIVAFDIGGLLGGAVLTETVFQWRSLGFMFQQGLSNFDVNPVMAVFLVTAVVAVIFNMVADIAYGFLDPRIRVTSS